MVFYVCMPSFISLAEFGLCFNFYDRIFIVELVSNLETGQETLHSQLSNSISDSGFGAISYALRAKPISDFLEFSDYLTGDEFLH